MFIKFTADKIFDGTRLLEGKVLITTTQGEVVELINIADAGDDIKYYKGIITPGFVNCHCHIELSHLKNVIPKHTGLVDFVLALMKNRDASEEMKYKAMRSAADELYESGTVAVGDICNTVDSISLKESSKLNWYNFIEVSGFVDATAQQRFHAGRAVADQFSKLPFENSIVPHAPYSVSKNLFHLINEHSRDRISIHNQEARAEDQLYKNKTGDLLRLYDQLGITIRSFEPTDQSSLQSWLPYFTKKQKILSVHNTFINQDDIDAANDVTFCICVNANLYIENTLPPLELFVENNCNIVLGTDSYASNTSLNMLEEMKSIQKHFPMIDIKTILQWATKNGAEALGISQQFGSFERGKKPCVVLIEKLNAENFSDFSEAKRLL